MTSFSWNTTKERRELREASEAVCDINERYGDDDNNNLAATAGTGAIVIENISLLKREHCNEILPPFQTMHHILLLVYL